MPQEITLAEVSAKSVGAAPAPVIKPLALSRGTLLTQDLDRAQRLFEDILGLQCVRPSPDTIVARHRNERSGSNYWVLEVRQSREIAHPQRPGNHWGVFVRTHEEVDQGFATVTANQDKYEIKRVRPPETNHGSYSFYFQDADSNWWEIEYKAPEISFGATVAGGDLSDMTRNTGEKH